MHGQPRCGTHVHTHTLKKKGSASGHNYECSNASGERVCGKNERQGSNGICLVVVPLRAQLQLFHCEEPCGKG